jgi:hypothetical protein
MYFTLEQHRRNKSVLSNSDCQVSSVRLPTLWQKVLRLYNTTLQMLISFFINPQSQLLKYQKLKLKTAMRGLYSTAALCIADCALAPDVVPSFISSGATTPSGA